LIRRGGAPPPTPPDPDLTAALTTPKNKDLKAKFGEKWFDFLKHELDRAGLFLITGEAGEFILCVPNTTQEPSYRLLREAGKTRNAVSVIKAHYKNTATTRYTTYIVHGRGGGSPTSSIQIPPDAPDDVRAALIAAAGSGAQKPINNAYTDPEMVAWGFPAGRAWTKKDPHVTSPAQCLYLAKRKAAEDRRRNWQLTYTVPGHTWPSLRAGGKRICWAIDTIVEVIDEDFGLNGNYWIESVAFQRGAQGSSTTLQLMRPEDLVFGDPTDPTS
jgi:prophage tail gpP-like protein